MTTYNKLEIDGTEYTNSEEITVDKVIGNFNSTCNASVRFNNNKGDFSDTFNLNNKVEVWGGRGAMAGLISHWRFEEGSGTTANDEMDANDGTITGATYVTGKVGKYALNFDGAGDTVVVTDNDSLDIGNISVAFWFKTNNDNEDLIRKWESTDNQRSWAISTGNGDNKIWFTISMDGQSGSGHTRDLVSTTSVDDGEWHHFVCTYDSTIGKLFLDGIEEDSDLLITDLFISTSDIKFADSFIRVNDFTGDMDDVRIYNRALTQHEVVELYNGGDGVDNAKIFSGVIENLDFLGIENNETLRISGRDYGAILQDTIVEPRVFKETEVSEIVSALMSQNISSTLITTNNVNVTTTTPDKITFQNVSVFDALKQLAEYSGFYFYVDVDNDLHFEEKESVSSGLTFDNTNVTLAKFKTSDDDVFNKVTVYGDRILSGHEQYFTANGGSVFGLDYQPHNLGVFISGTTNVIQQPGGVLNIDNPSRDDIKYLVDFQSQRFIMTSGTVAGDNIPTSGSDIIFTQYQKNTPIISVKSDFESQIAYGLKDKNIADKKIKDPEEATVRAQAFLDEHKDPVIEGDIDVREVVDVTPGNTAVVNIPFHNVNNQTYTIQSAQYTFNKNNNLGDDVLRVSLNKKIVDFTDTTKDILLRLKQAEMSQVDAGIVTLQTDIGSIGVSGNWFAVSRSIGSAFYFHTPGHNILNSTTSLLGDIRAGSIVESGGF